MANTSSFTPLELMRLPLVSALRDEFVGRPLSSLRTPALLIDRVAFKENCAQMGAKVDALGLRFRAHIKTHKTPEGTRLQVAGGARSLVTSTMPEVWGVLEAGIEVDDILYSLPISSDRMEDVNAAQEKAGRTVIRVMVDNAEQIAHLAAAAKRLGRRAPWSVFIKVDGGGRRAGAPPRSAQMDALLQAVKAEKAVEVYGFYSHFGHSYAARSLDQAGEYYAGEIACVNDAAGRARELGLGGDWVLSVGATPTAHAAALGAATPGGLNGTLELHAGCYCLNDLQQAATGLVREGGLALSVLATVVGKYAERGEVLTDCGALAVSKDQGPTPGFGRVVSKGHEGWSLGRVSQEHGVLVKGEGAREIEIGEKVRIVPQHACLACACHPWFYIVAGGGDEVVDVWVPWKGW
ncbi:hypothetical protein CC85DRAFT_280780 [Cutaneotrichosporon oleaginosum]|uniref:D-serine dehydratase n=1 Tax=Cutaneotrichosporon oleaginosum TaxID=879819 RepID=A0A0J0XC64_9TREE|nr:uncharacterized protein CC85DRAFT_280780 [Cutaneotrichosporon oleaginosum]KLT38655.1 hypothetical protein CC85DRAFT_280780 [Cutaneotrichosporon oleaginosum]TXT08284.1 hypothetical protein COLE_05208 [Cutaneotrichosporon oleaginosum]